MESALCEHKNTALGLMGLFCDDCHTFIRKGPGVNPDSTYPPGSEDDRKARSLNRFYKDGTIKLPITEQVGGSHYSRLAVQPFDLIKAMETSGDAFTDYARGAAIKYASRIKGDRDTLIQDLRKGAHYLEEAAKRLEGLK